MKRAYIVRVSLSRNTGALVSEECRNVIDNLRRSEEINLSNDLLDT